MNNGLKHKYIVSHVDPARPVDFNAEYFVLRLDDHAKDKKHLAACRKAIQTYAKEIESHLPELASDLRKRYPV